MADMISDEEVEAFEVTDFDLRNEFNPTRKKNLSKNQQIYGIWADESDDEDPRVGLGGSKKKKANYTAPMNFVAGGIQQAGQPKPEEEDERDDVISSEDDEPVVVQKRKKGGTSIAGMRYKKTGIGEWEKHTKGIGQKLLLQMGYQPGKGLGKELQGIAAPIEAHKREGRGAIGAYGAEKGQKVMDVVIDDGQEQEGEKREKTNRWKKGVGKKKTEYVYKTPEEVVATGTHKKVYPADSAISGIKVIDMRGKEQRVLSGYHAIHSAPISADAYQPPTAASRSFKNFNCPELLHNLDLLVDLCEQDIRRLDWTQNTSEDRLIALKQEEKTLKEVLSKEEKSIQKMEELIGLLSRLQTQETQKRMSLDEIAQVFQELEENYYEEYKCYRLGYMATTLVFPIIKEKLSEWKPLQDDPTEAEELLRRWKDILPEDVYSCLVWECWMPRVRDAISSWQIRNSEAMVGFIEHWMPYIPPWVLNNILEQMLVPRLQKEVNDWNPMKDTVPIHAWLHPWFALIGDRLESVYPVIRRKVGAALTSWHPSDQSAKMMLHPWTTVWGESTMQAFLTKYIAPKVELCLREMSINPLCQDLQTWKWIMEWNGIMSVHALAHILDRAFFGRWLQVLATWLNHNPSHDEVSQWYRGWKKLIPEPVLKHSVVRERLKSALELMQRSLGGSSIREELSYLQSMERQENERERPKAQREKDIETLSSVVSKGKSIPQGFRELLEMRCEEKGILLAPVPGKTHEAKQVYVCGKLHIYLDRSVIFAQKDSGGPWTPTSLQVVLDMAV